MSSEDARTVWVGNLDNNVTEELLYELFLQAGPLVYVRQPKDRGSGEKKNFAFVCYRHECSVPYAIALLSDIHLCSRNIRVQSRHLKNLQAQGLASYDHGGVHTLDPFEDENPTPVAAAPQGCHQQASLIGQPNSLMGDIPGNIPPHILALAQQQVVGFLNAQSVALHQNPMLNARMRRDDRYGSINYGRNYPRSDEQSYHGYNRSEDNRRGPRTIDNQTMQALKSRSEDSVAYNSEMLAGVQDRHGRFDMNRLGPRTDHHDNNRHQHDHHRSSNRDYRQQPYDRDHRQQSYDRHDSHHSRGHDRHTSYDSRRRYDNRSSNNSHRSSNSNDQYDRGNQSSRYGSRR